MRSTEENYLDVFLDQVFSFVKRVGFLAITFLVLVTVFRYVIITNLVYNFNVYSLILMCMWVISTNLTLRRQMKLSRG